MKSETVTLKGLSVISGYSVSTVSKAINNKKDISKDTRNIIQAIAKAHNYVPNNYAVGLRSKKSKSIAIVLPEVTQKSYNQALCTLQKTAENFGYRVLLYQSFHSRDKELDYIKRLNDGSIDGIILITKEDFFKTDLNENSVPVELLLITQNQSEAELKKSAADSFNNLLKAC